MTYLVLMTTKNITRLIASVATLVALIAATYTVGFSAGETASTQTQVVETQPTATKVKRIPAPTTAAGYKAMFAKVNTDLWGAADVSISQRLKDGRRVWLYGDTFSGRNGFVNSTAITQDGGRLHVSNKGKQLLPAGPKANGRKVVYWIEAVGLYSNGDLRIVAAPTSIGTADVWDFRRHTEKSRVARARVNAAGDVRFLSWTGWVQAPPSTNDFTVIGDNHFTYGGFTHDIRLSNGEYLRTVNQNWDDDIQNHMGPNGLRFEDFRPIFSSTKTAP